MLEIKPVYQNVLRPTRLYFVCVRACLGGVCMCACPAAVPWNPRPVSAPLQQTQRLVVPSMSLHHAGRCWRMPNMGSPRPADLQVQISSIPGLSTHWDGSRTHSRAGWMNIQSGGTKPSTQRRILKCYWA